VEQKEAIKNTGTRLPSNPPGWKDQVNNLLIHHNSLYTELYLRVIEQTQTQTQTQTAGIWINYSPCWQKVLSQVISETKYQVTLNPIKHLL